MLRLVLTSGVLRGYRSGLVGLESLGAGRSILGRRLASRNVSELLLWGVR